MFIVFVAFYNHEKKTTLIFIKMVFMRLGTGFLIYRFQLQFYICIQDIDIFAFDSIFFV